MDQRHLAFAHLFFFNSKLLLELRKFSVLELRSFIQVVVALCKLDLLINSFNLFTENGQIFHCFLFIIPLSLLGIKLVPQLCKLPLQNFQTLLTWFIRLFLKCCLFNLHLHDLSLQLIQLCRQGIQLCLDQGASLIHKVNGLIRQKPVGNIAVG